MKKTGVRVGGISRNLFTKKILFDILSKSSSVDNHEWDTPTFNTTL